MARKDALLKANRGLVGELNKETLRDILNIVYDDMAAGTGIQSVTISGEFDPIDNTAVGDLVLSIDDADPQNPIINLELVGA